MKHSLLILALLSSVICTGCGVGSSIPTDAEDITDTSMMQKELATGGTGIAPPSIGEEDIGDIGPITPVTPVMPVILPPAIVCGNISTHTMSCAGGN
jgi:hypothetical protein